MIRLEVIVDDITPILAAGWTHVRVYSDTAEGGSFATLEGTITLVASTTGYEYVDTAGTASKWYKVCYYAVALGEGSKSSARKGETFASYGTVAELRRRQGITDEEEDSTLGAMLDAISRAIDYITGERFYTTTSDETRYFTARWHNRLDVPLGLLTVTTLKTDEDGDRTYERTWQSTDYDLCPYNASLDSKPYTCLETTPQGSYAFPTVQKGIQIVGTFGYNTNGNEPAQISEAAYLTSTKLFRRRKAPFGVVGAPGKEQLKQMMLHDPEIMLLLAPFMKVGVFG